MGGGWRGAAQPLAQVWPGPRCWRRGSGGVVSGGRWRWGPRMLADHGGGRGSSEQQGAQVQRQGLEAQRKCSGESREPQRRCSRGRRCSGGEGHCRAAEGEPSHLEAQGNPCSRSGGGGDSPQAPKNQSPLGSVTSGGVLQTWRAGAVPECGSRLSATSRMHRSW